MKQNIHAFSRCPFLISHIVLIITEIYKTIKIYISDIYKEMSDILQCINYLRMKLHKSQGTETSQFSYWPGFNTSKSKY